MRLQLCVWRSVRALSRVLTAAKCTSDDDLQSAGNGRTDERDAATVASAMSAQTAEILQAGRFVFFCCFVFVLTRRQSVPESKADVTVAVAVGGQTQAAPALHAPDRLEAGASEAQWDEPSGRLLSVQRRRAATVSVSVHRHSLGDQQARTRVDGMTLMAVQMSVPSPGVATASRSASVTRRAG